MDEKRGFAWKAAVYDLAVRCVVASALALSIFLTAGCGGDGDDASRQTESAKSATTAPVVVLPDGSTTTVPTDPALNREGPPADAPSGSVQRIAGKEADAWASFLAQDRELACTLMGGEAHRQACTPGKGRELALLGDRFGGSRVAVVSQAQGDEVGIRFQNGESVMAVEAEGLWKIWDVRPRAGDPFFAH